MKPRLNPRAFTLIEVLVVVAIIALLVGILIPSLALARERARIVKCTVHLSNFPKAMYVFYTDHKGFGPAIGTQNELDVIDPSHTRYDYQQNMFDQTGPRLKPWPLALASALGEKSLKRAEQYCELNRTASPSYWYGKYGYHEIFACPSDKDPVHNFWSPREMYGILSFAANEDVLGVTSPPGCGDAGEGQPWKDGVTGDKNPVRATRLEGRLDRIIRPAEVVMFCDGGNEDDPKQPDLLLTNGTANPYIDGFEEVNGRLPHFRHSNKGGLTSAFADGSGKYLKPLRFMAPPKSEFVDRYEPRARITPYNP